jgi:hypothetical protein
LQPEKTALLGLETEKEQVGVVNGLMGELARVDTEAENWTDDDVDRFRKKYGIGFDLSESF